MNGFIIQKKEQRFYQGVDGDNWYLNYDYKNELGAFFEEHISKTLEYSDYVDVCDKIEYIKKYIYLSKNKNIDYRVLLCVTERKFPQIVLPTDSKMIFLGYDYAYSGGSYYSAVANDVIARRRPEFAKIQVNGYGLFETYEEITDFIDLRATLEQYGCNHEQYLEEGDFIIYKLYEMDI